MNVDDEIAQAFKKINNFLQNYSPLKLPLALKSVHDKKEPEDKSKHADVEPFQIMPGFILHGTRAELARSLSDSVKVVDVTEQRDIVPRLLNMEDDLKTKEQALQEAKDETKRLKKIVKASENFDKARKEATKAIEATFWENQRHIFDHEMQQLEDCKGLTSHRDKPFKQSEARQTEDDKLKGANNNHANNEPLEELLSELRELTALIVSI